MSHSSFDRTSKPTRNVLNTSKTLRKALIATTKKQTKPDDDLQLLRSTVKMNDMIATLALPNENATTRLGVCLAKYMRGGETLLLEGPIGAGKSHLARAFIQARLGRMEDVPSPTFTLVQVYEADVEIWHTDLYRLTHPDNVLELGLEEAFEHAICLVEWPDRLGSTRPERMVHLTLKNENEGRVALISGNLPWIENLREFA